MSGIRVAHRRVSPLAAAWRLALAASLLAGLAPASGAMGARPEPPPDGEPSIAYLEAMAHADDDIAFEPGARVSVPFAPRADDRWPVGGRAPVALPAGRASGREMAASRNGSAWAELGVPGETAAPSATPALDPTPVAEPAPASAVPSDAPVDAPAADPVLPAEGAAWTTADPGPGDAAGEDPAAAAGLRRQVFGFLPYWELTNATAKLDLDVLSTIAYFSVGVGREGNLRKRDADGTTTTGWGGWTSSSMTSVINAAHRQGTRVVLTVTAFAWTSSQAEIQRALLGSADARRNLARQAAAAVRDRGADGVNLDFEPLASGYEDGFLALLRAVRSELDAIGPGYQLTYDTTGYIGNYPLEASVGASAADAVFVMGYDYRTAGSGTAGSIDPLSGPTYDLADTVRLYTARIPASRLILGLPWYGRAWSTVDDSVRSETRDGAKYGYSTAVNYESVTDLVARHGRRWDAREQSPYVAYQREHCTATYGCVTSWRQVYYDDKASMAARLAMVDEHGLRGAGIWALGYDGDHPEPFAAFREAFLLDVAAPRAGVHVLPATEADEGFVVTWSAADVSAVAGYDVQVSQDGGAWTAWLTDTTATSDVWLGRDGAAYAFRVRARDAKGNTGGWNVTSVATGTPALAPGGFGRVVTDGLAYRAGPTTSAARLGSMEAGTIVAVTSGPVSAGGYTWYEITQPIREWTPVGFVQRGVWAAATASTTTHIAAFRAPNGTRVDAGIAGLDFGAGESALGPGVAARDRRTFSPNGDGFADALRLRWTNTVGMDALELRVHRADGEVVGSVAVAATGAGARTWDWNGRAGGSRVPDGRYVLQLVGRSGSATYRAPSARPATPSQVERFAVTVDTVPPVVTSRSASTTVISPNGDGRLDSVRLTLAADGAARWTAEVANAAGTTVRAASGTGGSAVFTWTGIDADGRRVPDGSYTATLAAWDAAGNAGTSRWTITVDTTGPTVTPSVSVPLFSPNGDGTADTVALRWAAGERASGHVRVYRGDTLVRTWSAPAGTAGSVTWDGRRADGTAAPEGRHTVRVTLLDAAGNARTASTSVVLDRTASRLRWSRAFFPHDGDALAPNATLTWRLSRSASTTLRIVDASGRLVRTVWSDRVLQAGTASWRWNGRRADGSLVPQGRYTASLAVTSRFGTAVLTRPVVVAAFAVSPSATRVAPGDTLVVRFTSIEPLASRPVVVFRQPGRTAVKVTATQLSDGTWRAAFVVAPGAAGDAIIRVRGRDTGGGVNVSTLSIRVQAP